MSSAGFDGERLNLRTSEGHRVAAIFGGALSAEGFEGKNAEGRSTILYFYGHGGSIAWSMDVFDRLRRLGANVLIADYVGFGMSEGEPSEENAYATADAAYEYLLQRDGIDPAKIIVMGWSLGGAVAIDLASRKPVAGVATFNTFTSVRDMARLALPYFPAAIADQFRFDNDRKIAGITCPVFICNGLRDAVVPPRMSDELAKLAKGPVTRLTLKSATHSTIFTAEPKNLFPALQTFVNRIAKRRDRSDAA